MLTALILAGLLQADPGRAGPVWQQPGPRAHPGFVAALPVANAAVPGKSLPAQEATPDSADLRDRAKDAQASFERRRRRRAPLTWSGSNGDCDAIVGRMCMRFEGDDDDDPKPEKPDVADAREELIAELAEVSALIPGDRWVRGQHVWYLIEAGRPDEAVSLSRRCPVGAGWWCHGLLGLALHADGRIPESLAAFERALAEMPEEDAEDWHSIEKLLDRDGRKWLERRADEGDEAEATDLFWRLSEPLFLTEGNERRTEHYARWMVSHIRDRARNGYGVRWGNDLRELLVRYGWEIGWERSWPRPGARESEHMLGHQHPDAVQFVPPGDVLEAPEAVHPGEWVLDVKVPQATYAPGTVPAVDSLRAVSARFPREGHIKVVVGFDAEWGDSLVGPRETGVFAMPLDAASDSLVHARAQGPPGSYLAEVPFGHAVISAEVLVPEAEQGARARFGVDASRPVPGIPTVSDLLLVESSGPLPASLEEALADTGPVLDVESGGRVRALWEVSGLGQRPESLAYSFEFERTDGGFFRRAGQWLRIVGRDEAQLLSWTEGVEASRSMVFRALDLDLPELDEGEYLLRLNLQMTGRADMHIERRFRVVSQHSASR